MNRLGVTRCISAISVGAALLGMVMLAVAGEPHIRTNIGKIYYARDAHMVERDMVTGVEKETLWLGDGTSDHLKKGEDPLVKRRWYSISRSGCVLAYIESRFQPANARKDCWTPEHSFVVVKDLASGKSILQRSTEDMIRAPLSISPNGHFLAITSSRDSLKTVYTPRLRVIDVADGRNLIRPIVTNLFEGGATWSPDSKRVAVLASNGRTTIIDLYHQRRYGLRMSGRPFWSPDGRYIAADNYLYDVRLKTYRKWTRTEGPIPAGWSPDSKRLIYIKGRVDRLYNLHVYDIDSGDTADLPIPEGGYDVPILWVDPVPSKFDRVPKRRSPV